MVEMADGRGDSTRHRHRPHFKSLSSRLVKCSDCCDRYRRPLVEGAGGRRTRSSVPVTRSRAGECARRHGRRKRCRFSASRTLTTMIAGEGPGHRDLEMASSISDSNAQYKSRYSRPSIHWATSGAGAAPGRGSGAASRRTGCSALMPVARRGRRGFEPCLGQAVVT